MTGSNATPVRDLDAIFHAALERVDPYRMILDHVRMEKSRLVVRMDDGEFGVELNDYKRILVLGAGKATAPMAKAFEEILGPRLSGGLIVVKYGHGLPLERVQVIESGHPVPDENGVRGAQALKDLALSADAETLVLTLISGGGSALLPAPMAYECEGQARRLTLADKQDVTRALLRCGASINEINCIRKHLSDLKGGRLLQHIAPAANLSFILSDVVGDDLSSIASGMTSPDPTSYADALAIFEKYGLALDEFPRAAEVLRLGAQGLIEETLQPDSPDGRAAVNILLGTNRQAMAAAREKAVQLGYNVVSLTSRVTGEAGEIARLHAAVAADVATAELLVAKPACVLSGGEPVVTLQGSGKGGRNQEMALTFLREIERQPGLYRGVSYLAASTDGNDGPTDAAGAFASLELLDNAKTAGLSIEEYLRNNDSYHFFEKIDGLYKTGPTNTNVCDLHITLVR